MVAPAEPGGENKFCHVCGGPLGPGDAACPSCGAPVRGATSEQAPADQPVAPTEPIPAARTEPISTATPSASAAPAAASPQPAATSRPSPLSGVPRDVIVLVVALLLAAGGGWFLTRAEDGGATATDIDSGGGDPQPPIDDDDSPDPPEDDTLPTTEPTSDDGGVATGSVVPCFNENIGYTLAYPSHWFTTSGIPRQECRFFHHSPLNSGNSPVAEAAIQIHYLRAGYLDWVGSYNQESVITVNREDTFVAGHEAVLVEFSFADDPGGYLSYLYMIELNGRPLLLGTQAEQAGDYEAAKAIVDEMVASLAFL